MYVVTEADATAIREVYEREGELSAAIELKRRFRHPGQRQGAGAGKGYCVLDAITAPPSAHPAGAEGQGAVDAVCRSLTLLDVAGKTDTRWLSGAGGARGQA